MKKYSKIAYCICDYMKDIGGIMDYFINSSSDFYAYIIPPSYNNSPTIMRHYKEGVLKEEVKVFWYKGKNKFIIYLCYYFYYLYFLVHFNIKKTFIFCYHPIFLMFSGIINIFFKNKMVFFVLDYFFNKSFLYRMYDGLVKFYVNQLKFVLFASEKLLDLNVNVLKKTESEKIRKVVSLGIINVPVERNYKSNLFGFIGSIQTQSGLEMVIEILKKDSKYFFEIVGGGLGIDAIKNEAVKAGVYDRIKFLGFVEDKNIYAITSRWEIAFAPYLVDNNFSVFYTEPGKIKLYVQLEVPFIITNVGVINKDIIDLKAGLVVNRNCDDFISAIEIIQSQYELFQEGVKKVKINYSSLKHYNEAFKFLDKCV